MPQLWTDKKITRPKHGPTPFDFRDEDAVSEMLAVLGLFAIIMLCLIALIFAVVML